MSLLTVNALYFESDLKRHLKRAMEVNDTSKENERVALYFGHSAVLQLALVGLGVYRHICANPPFGGRVTFEVWERDLDIRRLDEAFRGGTSLRGSTSDMRNLRQSKDNRGTNTFVRVLYLGKDITHLIPTCVMKAEPDDATWFDIDTPPEMTAELRENRKLDSAQDSPISEHAVMCPLDRLFLHFDSGLRMQYPYLPEDCQKTYAKISDHYKGEFKNDV